MKTLLKVGFAASLCLAAVTSYCQVTPSKGGYLFRYKYTKGNTYRFNMASTTKNAQLNVGVSWKFKVTVLSVTKSNAKLRYDIDPIMVNGKPAGQKQTAEVKLDRQGNSLSDSGSIQQLGNVAYPSEPVAIGKYWKRNVNSNAMGVKMNMVGTYTFTGIKNVGGKKCAVVSVAMNNSGDFKASGKGTMLVDMADGMVYNYTMNMTLGVNTGQGSQPMATVVTIKRL